MTTINNFVKVDKIIEIDTLKIDVEEFELEIMRGAGK